MLRFTLTGPLVMKIRANYTSNPIIQSVYRWGSAWGILQEGDWNHRWNVEIRSTLAYETKGDTASLLESVHVVDIQGPPLQLDDFWKEEVEVNGPLTCGTLLSFIGTPEEIQAFCEKERIPIADSFRKYLSADKSDSKIQHVL